MICIAKSLFLDYPNKADKINKIKEKQPAFNNKENTSNIQFYFQDEHDGTCNFVEPKSEAKSEYTFLSLSHENLFA